MKNLVLFLSFVVTFIGYNPINCLGQIPFERYDSIDLTGYSPTNVMVYVDDMDNDQQNEIISIYEASLSLMKITKMMPNGTHTSSNWSFPLYGMRNFITLNANKDADTLKDIAFVHSDSVTIIIRDSAWMFSNDNRISFYSGLSADGIAKGDFNNDGKDDFFCTNWNDNHLSMFIQANSGFSEYDIPAVQSGHNQAKVFDVNQDGWDDLIFMAGQGSSSGIYVYLNENGLFPSAPLYFSIISSVWGNLLNTTNVSFGDFFGIGPGLLINSSSGSTDDTRFIQFQAGNFPVVMIVQNMGTHNPSSAAADFDLNGNDDVVYLPTTSQDLQVLSFDGFLNNTSYNISTIGGNYHAFDQLIAIGDVVGNDSKSDIVMISDWGQILILKNTTTMTGIQPPSSDPQIKLYPNPTTDYLNISLGLPGDNSCIISDVSGRIVLEKTYHGQNFRIDLRGFPTGVYLLRIKEKQSLSRKFVIR
jgi:hypothetical protein